MLNTISRDLASCPIDRLARSVRRSSHEPASAASVRGGLTPSQFSNNWLPPFPHKHWHCLPFSVQGRPFCSREKVETHELLIRWTTLAIFCVGGMARSGLRTIANRDARPLVLFCFLIQSLTLKIVQSLGNWKKYHVRVLLQPIDWQLKTVNCAFEND